MKLAALAISALLALSSATAWAACTEQHACADGFTWSADTGGCVPTTVSS